MSDKKQNLFLQKYLRDEVLADEIDDFIDAWHAKSNGKKIFEFLGMTKEEYSLWLCAPDSLPEIARARQAHLPLIDVVRAQTRAGSSPKTKQLMQWLEQAETHPAK